MGKPKPKKCTSCGGTGRRGVLEMVGGRPTRVGTVTCIACNGTGRS